MKQNQWITVAMATIALTLASCGTIKKSATNNRCYNNTYYHNGERRSKYKLYKHCRGYRYGGAPRKDS